MIDFLPDSPFLSDSPFRQFFVFARSSPLAIFRHWWLLSLFSSYSPFSSWSPLSKRPLLSFNLNVFQTHGEFCQIRHFRQPLDFVRSTFVTSFKFSLAVWRFFAKFAIFAVGYISGHISKMTILDIIQIFPSIRVSVSFSGHYFWRCCCKESVFSYKIEPTCLYSGGVIYLVGS